MTWLQRGWQRPSSCHVNTRNAVDIYDDKNEYNVKSELEYSIVKSSGVLCS